MFEGYTELDNARRVADWFAQTVSEVVGSARVARSLVSGGVGEVTVSAHGRLLRVELSPDASRLRPDKLAACIQSAYVDACESAVAQIREQIKQVTATNPEMSDLFEQLDRDFGRLATALHPPERTSAAPERPSAGRRAEWEDPEEWNPWDDPLNRGRR